MTGSNGNSLMISSVEALNYRCLRYVRQSLGKFQVLVGPNASGKSTFLDAVAFLGDLLRDGPEAAVMERASRIDDLVWNQKGKRFEIAVELDIPPEKQPEGSKFGRCRYEVAVGTERAGQLRMLAETLWLFPIPSNGQQLSPARGQRTLFPEEPTPPDTIFSGRKGRRGWRAVVKKVEESGNDYFRSETGDWNNLFRFGPTKAAFANLPEDPSKFPVATWAKRVLMEGVQELTLNSLAMRQPCPPGMGRAFRPDGSNLPFVVQSLQRLDYKRFQAWLDHVRTALPDITMIKVNQRPEDRSRYLTIQHSTSLRVPSWLVSDGTLRILALTLLAYVQPAGAAYLIEEPENGIHPQAVETVFQSLSSAYESQVLVATHSPVFLRLAEPAHILCFSKTKTGATDIVSGSSHPRLKNWKGDVSLADLYVAGVLS